MTHDNIERALGALEADGRAAREQLTGIFRRLDDIRDTQGKIAGCLPGIKTMVEDHEGRLRSVEAEGHRRVGRAGFIGGTVGAVFTGLSALAAWMNLR